MTSKGPTKSSTNCWWPYTQYCSWTWGTTTFHILYNLHWHWCSMTTLLFIASILGVKWDENIIHLCYVVPSNYFIKSNLFDWLADAYELWLWARQYLHSLHQEHASYCPWSPSVRWRGWSPPFWRLSEPIWTQHSSKRGEESKGREGLTQEEVKRKGEKRSKEENKRKQRRGNKTEDKRTKKKRVEEKKSASQAGLERKGQKDEARFTRAKSNMAAYVLTVLGVLDINCWAVKLSEIVSLPCVAI